jgi:hypothetical protein
LKDEGPYRRIILKGGRTVVEIVRVWSVTFEARIRSETSFFGGFLVALKQVFVEVLPLSPVSIFPPLLLTHSFTFDERYVSSQRSAVLEWQKNESIRKYGGESRRK